MNILPRPVVGFDRPGANPEFNIGKDMHGKDIILTRKKGASNIEHTESETQDTSTQSQKNDNQEDSSQEPQIQESEKSYQHSGEPQSSDLDKSSDDYAPVESTYKRHEGEENLLKYDTHYKLSEPEEDESGNSIQKFKRRPPVLGAKDEDDYNKQVKKMSEIVRNPYALDAHLDEMLTKHYYKKAKDESEMDEEELIEKRNIDEFESRVMPDRIYGHGEKEEYWYHPDRLKEAHKPMTEEEFQAQLYDGISEEEYTKQILGKHNPPDKVVFRCCPEEDLYLYGEWSDFLEDRVKKLRGINLELHEGEPMLEFYKDGVKKLEYAVGDKSLLQMHNLLKDVGYVFEWIEGEEPEHPIDFINGFENYKG